VSFGGSLGSGSVQGTWLVVGGEVGVPDRFDAMDVFHLRLGTAFFALRGFRVTLARFALAVVRAVFLGRLESLALGLRRFAMCIRLRKLAPDVKRGYTRRINVLSKMNLYK